MSGQTIETRAVRNHLAITDTRMDALKEAVDSNERERVEWEFDRVRRSLDKLTRLMGSDNSVGPNNTVIGRGAALLARFTDDLHQSFGGPPVSKARAARLRRHRIGKLMKRTNGGAYEVSLVGDDGRPTGYIALVQVSYSRFDEGEANQKGASDGS